MIFHLSIEAENPRHVAQVFAEIWGGVAMPFPAVADGSWFAHACDDRNTMVEVYPRGTVLRPADQGAVGHAEGERRHGATHFAIATRYDEASIHEIGQREGWHVETFSRGGLFRVIELWIEGHQMVEVLTPEMQREYLDSLSIARLSGMAKAA
jgi:hypothetical protein